MTTWTEVSEVNETYERPSDVGNNYVAVDYVQNDYILPRGVWSDVSPASTTWA